MAKRYSGSLQINVTYDDRGHYRTSISSGGKLLWRGTVNPAPSGFGPGIAYDSPQAYDEVASSAISFADDEKGDIADEADYNEDLSGYLIKRSPHRKTAKALSSHARKKIDPLEAKRRLEVAGVDFSKDFHALPSSQVDLVLDAARTAGYRKRKDAPGSTARMYFQRLSRLGGGLKHDVGDSWISRGRLLGTLESPKASLKPAINVQKIGPRWQPVNSGGHVVRGDVYNADGRGYNTRESAVEAAAMLRTIGTRSHSHAKIQRKTTAYRLKLTPSELNEVSAASGKHAWADMLAAKAMEDGTVLFSANEMQQWVDDVEADENEYNRRFSRVSPRLAGRLEGFRMEQR